jgi:hypothetical protein
MSLEPSAAPFPLPSSASDVGGDAGATAAVVPVPVAAAFDDVRCCLPFFFGAAVNIIIDVAANWLITSLLNPSATGNLLPLTDDCSRFARDDEEAEDATPGLPCGGGGDDEGSSSAEGNSIAVSPRGELPGNEGTLRNKDWPEALEVTTGPGDAGRWDDVKNAAPPTPLELAAEPRPCPFTCRAAGLRLLAPPACTLLRLFR